MAINCHRRAEAVNADIVLSLNQYLSMVEAVPPAAVPSADELAVWFHYEEVAMHFNEILIQFRRQLLGGAGSMATVALYLIDDVTVRGILGRIALDGMVSVTIASGAMTFCRTSPGCFSAIRFNYFDHLLNI